MKTHQVIVGEVKGRGDQVFTVLPSTCKYLFANYNLQTGEVIDIYVTGDKLSMD